MMSGGGVPDMASMMQDPNIVNAAQQLASENPELVEQMRGAASGGAHAGGNHTEEIDE